MRLEDVGTGEERKKKRREIIKKRGCGRRQRRGHIRDLGRYTASNTDIAPSVHPHFSTETRSCCSTTIRFNTCHLVDVLI